jgi:hypothetical protein
MQGETDSPDVEGEELEDKDERTHRIDGDPTREGGKGARERTDRGAREQRDRPQQPGGGRQSESEKPDSPDSRWGGGRNA